MIKENRSSHQNETYLRVVGITLKAVGTALLSTPLLAQVALAEP
jgi:hypothetical protein